MKTKNRSFMESSQFTLKHELLFCLLITIAIASIYGQVINHEFVSFDDLVYVVENSHVQQGLTPDGFKWAFSFQNKEGTYWHPLTWLSHMADVTMFGNQAGFHLLINILWHTLNTCLLFFLLHRTTRMFWLSVLTASLFGVHPLNVETVAWISERKNLLSTFFWLLSIAAYVYYTRSPNFFKYVLVFLVYVTGLLAKPMLVTLPFVFLLLDYWPLNRISLQLIKKEKKKPFSNWINNPIVSLILEKIPLICIAFMVSYLVTESLNVVTESLNKTGQISFNAVPLYLRIENLLVSYASYLGKFIWPVNLAVFYPFPKSLSIAQVLASTLTIASITIIFLGPLKKKKYLTVGWLWFLGTLTPVSGLIQAGLWPAMADRWTYIPFIGLFIIFSGCIQELVHRQTHKHAWSFSIILFTILLLGTISWHQVQYWQNSTTLFSHAVTVTTDNNVAHTSLGSSLSENGRIEEAISHFYQAIAITPRYVGARTNLVYLLEQQGRTEEAARIYEEGVQFQPNAFKSKNKIAKKPDDKQDNEEAASFSKTNPIEHAEDSDAHFNRAKELTKLGRIEEAIEHYLKVVAVAPDHYESLNNLALLFGQLGKNAPAISHFNRALVVAPDNAEIHYNLAYSLAATGRVEEAEKHFTRALELYPSFVKAHNNLGILLAQESRTDEAISHFAEAVRIDPSSIDGHTNMGIILFNLGKKDQTLYHFQEAVKLSPENEYLQQLLQMVSPR